MKHMLRKVLMKHMLRNLAVLTALTALTATAAEAGNSTVENALKSRDDLSLFYAGLVNTGVINELQEGQSYTVFAPTNEAFAKLPQSQYPCFYSAECKGQVAEILRNHIVPGEKHLSDIGTQAGGIMSMFSIDNRHVIGSEPSRGSYAVDGEKVLSENQLFGSILYRVDGLIATPRELAVLTPAPVIRVSSTGLPPRVPEGTVVSITSSQLIPDEQ